MSTLQKIVDKVANRSHAKKNRRNGYGTFAKAISMVTKTAVIPIAEEPQVYAVDVKFMKFGMDEPVEEIGEPVPTPTEKASPFEELFDRNDWWLRGADNKWYPYDKYLERLDGLDRKRERIYGLWVNLTSPNKTCVINRWNDGDAAIALMLRTSSGEKEETIGPADKEWKMPLWMKAQPFRLVCRTNPFLEGEGMEFDDDSLDDTFDADDISQPRSRFISVETMDEFSPKMNYPRHDNYERIFFN